MWIEEARHIAAQCWCEENTKNKVLDVDITEAVARRIAAWMETAAQNARNTEYYRGLVVRCGETLGREAYVQDDGGLAGGVICAKVPEIVEARLGLKYERIHALAWMLAQIHASDGDCVGVAARELYAELDCRVSEEWKEIISAEFDC